MTTTTRHARQFLKNSHHFSSTAAEAAKNISQRLRSQKGIKDAMFFLQQLIDTEINFTCKGAKAEAIEILSKLKKENPNSNSTFNKTSFLNKMGFSLK